MGACSALVRCGPCKQQQWHEQQQQRRQQGAGQERFAAAAAASVGEPLQSPHLWQRSLVLLRHYELAIGACALGLDDCTGIIVCRGRTFVVHSSSSTSGQV